MTSHRSEAYAVCRYPRREHVAVEFLERRPGECLSPQFLKSTDGL